MRTGALLLAASLAAVSCVRSSHSSPAMVGGEVVTGMDQPAARHVVGIRRQASTTRTDYCTGTLVGDDVVLTAAHCVDTYPAPDAIAFGLDIFAPDVTLRRIVKMKRHKRFASFNYANDVALIWFEGPLPEGHAPAMLAGSLYETVEKGTALFGLGFGKASATPANGILRRLSLSITENDPTGHTFKAQGPEGTGVCFGDSGGPAFLGSREPTFQVGIVSNGETQCENEKTTFTNVIDYRGWIEAELAEAGSAAKPFAAWDTTQSAVPAGPRDGQGNPLTFEGWCNDFPVHNDDVRRTTGLLLRKAGTWNCRKAAEALQELRELDFSYAYLTDAAPLASLTQLRTLSLRGNSLRGVASLAALTQLTTLDVRDNRNLPEECPLSPPARCIFH